MEIVMEGLVHCFRESSWWSVWDRWEVDQVGGGVKKDFQGYDLTTITINKEKGMFKEEHCGKENI